MATPILDVDLMAFERGDARARAAVVDGVMRSLGTGFVTTSHDLGEGFLDDVYETLRAFFALPAEVKADFVARGSRGQTGYTPVAVETAASMDVPDWKEMLNWGRTLPAAHPLRRRYPHRYMEPVLPESVVPGSAALLEAFHDRVAGLARRFLRVVATGLGLHEAFFDESLRDGPTLTRAVHYPPMARAPAPGALWAGPHGDIDLLTLLPRATAPGLQVRIADAWCDVAPPPGHAVVNSGLMLERLTNGRIPAAWHRVAAAAGQAGDRLSVVQFCHPTPWTWLAPLPGCVSAGRPLRWSGIEAGNLLDQVLWEINLGRDA